MALYEFTFHLKSGQTFKIRAETLKTSRDTTEDVVTGYTIGGSNGERVHTLCPSQIVAVTERKLSWWKS